MSILVIAEHNNQALAPATLNCIGAAIELKAFAEDITILVIGHGCEIVAKEACQIANIKEVLLADSADYEHQLAENVGALVVDLAKNYSHIMTASTTTGKNLMPRIAALLDVMQISDIITVESADTYKRPMYAGNVIATVKSNDPIKVLTVRTTAFDPVPMASSSDTSCAITAVDTKHANNLTSYVGEEIAKSERPELTSAEIIISGGRGMADGKNFKLLEKIADLLGAAIGASRAAVDAGFVPNDMQVGQTGKIVAPQLYIAVGISGAIQHLAGMKDSKVIVAINKDEEAPIFQVSDYGLVGDLFEILPELEKALS